jgi:D-alanyl-D-alanine carboxypeptidase
MKNINSFLKQQVENHQTPSIQYAIFDTESIIYEMQYGSKNVERKEKIDSSTTYHLFSVTKTFTALAVLQLAQGGKIELNKPVSFYLADFPYDKEITIEQVLSHTSGIPNPLPLRWIHLASEHKDFSRDEFFGEIFRKNPKLEFATGSNFKYSNLGYVILGLLIENVSKQSFEDYCIQNIFGKCDIEKSVLGFEIDPTIHAVGYHKWWSVGNAIFGFLIDKSKYMGKREGKWKPFNKFYNNGIAYGGMIGSSSGLIKYVQTLLKDDSILLNNKYKEILFTERLVDGKPTGMSFSWFTGSLKGNRYFAHAGGGGGYYVELRVYPELGVGSVILYNRSGLKDERILNLADSFFITETADAQRKSGNLFF